MRAGADREPRGQAGLGYFDGSCRRVAVTMGIPANCPGRMASAHFSTGHQRGNTAAATISRAYSGVMPGICAPKPVETAAKIAFAEGQEKKPSRQGGSESCIVLAFRLRSQPACRSAAVASAQAQQPAAPAAEPIKLGIVAFLTGPAASPFGVPGRNGAEIVIEALNAGKAPAPFDTLGLGGAKIEARYVDENGSIANVVTEFRNLVQRDKVDAVVGYISSGSCLAVTPVAEELKALTVYFDCGTPRIFEEKARKYVFRSAGARDDG